MAIVVAESERVASIAGIRLGQDVVKAEWRAAKAGWWMRAAAVAAVDGMDATLAARIVDERIAALRFEGSSADIARVIALEVVDASDREWSMPKRPTSRSGRGGSTISSTYRRFWLRLHTTIRIDPAARSARMIAALEVCADRYLSREERAVERSSAEQQAYAALLDKIFDEPER